MDQEMDRAPEAVLDQEEAPVRRQVGALVPATETDSVRDLVRVLETDLVQDLEAGLDQRSAWAQDLAIAQGLGVLQDLAPIAVLADPAWALVRRLVWVLGPDLEADLDRLPEVDLARALVQRWVP